MATPQPTRWGWRGGRQAYSLESEQGATMARRLTLYILIAMILGIITGYVLHKTAISTDHAKEIAGYFKVVTDIFLRLIKMIIAPLVLSTLIVGIAHIGDGAALGRVGVKTMAWFLVASLVSLSLGMVMVNLLTPGVGLNIDLSADASAAGVSSTALNLKDFITHLVPKSLFEAMANNEILQIVVFSIFAGTALSALGEKAKRVTELAEQVAFMMLRITEYVMLAAPIAVFAAIAAVITTEGLGVLLTYGEFIGEFYLSLAILWVLLLLSAFAFLGRRTGDLIRAIREPILLAFSTASSEAAYPKTLEQLERFGVSNRIASFVLPLGYSFNLDGSMMYCTFAVLFIAQAAGIDLTIAEQITMLLFLMVTSKGMAGVPRASLVVIAATLTTFDLPEAGLLLILGIDQFLDMGRSATNVVGNSVATAVVAKWEGQLRDPAIEPGAVELAVGDIAEPMDQRS
jgi:Na+/H+-dicarboxylate symporter